MTLTQSPIGGIGHRQKRGVFRTDAKVQQSHNVGVLQTEGGAGLVDEFLQVLGRQPRLQQLDRGQTVFVDMLPQVDLAEAASAQETGQAILAKLLAHTLYHRQKPLVMLSSDMLVLWVDL